MDQDIITENVLHLRSQQPGGMENYVYNLRFGSGIVREIEFYYDFNSGLIVPFPEAGFSYDQLQTQDKCPGEIKVSLDIKRGIFNIEDITSSKGSENALGNIHETLVTYRICKKEDSKNSKIAEQYAGKKENGIFRGLISLLSR